MRRLSFAVLLLMTLAFAATVISILPQKCIIPDDSMHMPAGLSYLKTRDFRLNQEHPPLIKMLSGLGLIIAGAELPLDSPAWRKAAEPGDPDDGTTDFEEAFFAKNASRFERIAFWGRAPLVLVPMILAIVVWWFVRDLRLAEQTSAPTSFKQELPALLAAFLLLSEPNVLGDTTMVQDDLASATVCVLFVIALRSYLRAPSARRAALVGLAIGAGLITKFSLLILGPVALAVIGVHSLWSYCRTRVPITRAAYSITAMMAAAYFVLLAGYGFQVRWIDEDQAELVWGWLHMSGRFANVLTGFITHLPILLPKYFLSGLDLIVDATRGGVPGFLFGQISRHGWWYYFPVAFALKTSLLFLFLSVAGIGWAVWRIWRQRWWDGLSLLLPPLIYFGFCATSTLNIGVRHFQPAFPFFAMMAAGVVVSMPRAINGWRKRLPELVAGAVVILSLGTAASAYPNHLGYFNALGGGPASGWKLLSDSNVETGQEVEALASYLKQHGESTVTGLFIGSEFIRFYGVELYDFPPEFADEDDPAEQPKYVALGVWFLQGIDITPEQNAAIEPFRHRQPDAVISNSIFLYKTR